jgi:sugar-phosphatase
MVQNKVNLFECDAVLFDLDGVLVDSIECIERIWREWAARHNISFTELMQVAHGRRTVETVQLIAPHLDPMKELEVLEGEESTSLEGVRIINGAFELLSSLPKDYWAIVTSGSRRTATARLNFAELPIPKVLVTADDIERGKPAPDAYLLAARGLGIEPQHCLVIEDAPAGIRAAHNASMPAIAIATTYHKEELLEADAIVTRLTDIEIDRNPHSPHRHLQIRIQNSDE